MCICLDRPKREINLLISKVTLIRYVNHNQHLFCIFLMAICTYHTRGFIGTIN